MSQSERGGTADWEVVQTPHGRAIMADSCSQHRDHPHFTPVWPGP